MVKEGQGLKSKNGAPKFILVLFPGGKSGKEIQEAAGIKIEVSCGWGGREREEGGGGGGEGGLSFGGKG